MDWSDEGFVLSARPHGESSAIISLLTRGHGRHAGLVRGGAGRRQRGVLQPGNRLSVTWRARLDEHLGAYTCEAQKSYAAAIMNDAGRLAALLSACAILENALPEREPHGDVFDDFSALLTVLDTMGGAGTPWGAAYVKWELALLGDMGFGLDLSRCAATGETTDLVYVSPKTGRAVSRGAGAPYKEKLLPLPAFLRAGTLGPELSAADLLDGLRLTGHFLEHCLFAPHHKGIPRARADFLGRIDPAKEGEGENNSPV